jgi:hypothetical protein
MPQNIAHHDGRDGGAVAEVATDLISLTRAVPVINSDPNGNCDGQVAVKCTGSDAVPDTVRAGPHPGYGVAFHKLLTGCWVWQRSFDDDGYGYFRRNRKVVRAHVHYYEQKHGPVPDGMEVDHLCRNRACVNPDHLEAVTHLENCRRGRLVKTGMTIEKAREARRMKAEGVRHKEIGARLGIGISLVAQIVTNRCWREEHTPSPLAEGRP